MPYLGFKQKKFNKELKSIINKIYPATALNTVPINPLTIGCLFNFKDKSTHDMRL